LGIAPQPHTLLVSDKEPAVFWITHPSNDLINNHAVGGKFGFWSVVVACLLLTNCGC
jgi:hypothetical protein